MKQRVFHGMSMWGFWTLRWLEEAGDSDSDDNDDDSDEDPSFLLGGLTLGWHSGNTPSMEGVDTLYVYFYVCACVRFSFIMLSPWISLKRHFSFCKERYGNCDSLNSTYRTKRSVEAQLKPTLSVLTHCCGSAVLRRGSCLTPFLGSHGWIFNGPLLMQFLVFLLNLHTFPVLCVLMSIFWRFGDVFMFLNPLISTYLLWKTYNFFMCRFTILRRSAQDISRPGFRQTDTQNRFTTCRREKEGLFRLSAFEAWDNSNDSLIHWFTWFTWFIDLLVESNGIIFFMGFHQVSTILWILLVLLILSLLSLVSQLSRWSELMWRFEIKSTWEKINSVREKRICFEPTESKAFHKVSCVPKCKRFLAGRSFPLLFQASKVGNKNPSGEFWSFPFCCLSKSPSDGIAETH